MVDEKFAYYLNIQSKIMEWMAFCGNENRDYASFLKNAVHFLAAYIYKMKL